MVGKKGFIDNWLDNSCRSDSTESEIRNHLSDDMPRRAAAVLPSPGASFESSTSISKKSEKSVASVHDADYRQSLRHRNIYIEREDPPVELMRRARRMISRSRTSPEMDDAEAEDLRLTARRLQDEGEDKIIKQMVPDIIPAMSRVPDSRLEMNSDSPWFNSVPVPLDRSILTNPLPLPRPKPDLAFGYSEAAFTRDQLGTIDLLIDDQYGRSFATPDQKLKFPFLDIEFKSQAKHGTHYVATNQAAGAGAIALNGNMDLMQRIYGTEGLDYDEPQFFSVTMDHELARINVHWLGAPVKGRQPGFHVEGLSQHLLNDANGLRAVIRAIKNILDFGVDARLRTLCKALDAYRETIVRNREAANPYSKQRDDVRSERDPEPRHSRRSQQPRYDQQGLSHQSSGYEATGLQQSSHGQQTYQSADIQGRSYRQPGQDSQDYLSVGGTSQDETGSLELQAEQRPRRKGTSRSEPEQDQAHLPAKARRTTSRRS